MKNDVGTVEADAEILKQIDEKLKGLSPDVRKEAFQILVQRHLGVTRRDRGPEVAVIGKAASKKERSKKATDVLTVVKDLNL